MRGRVESLCRQRLRVRLVRTLDTVERTNRILQSADDRVTLSRRPPPARITSRHTASVPRMPIAWPAYLVDQLPNPSRRQPLQGAEPPALDPSNLQQQIAGILARVTALTEQVGDGGPRNQLAIADAAARDTRHWLLDEPRHTPESLRDIHASVQAIVKALDAIDDDPRKS